MSKHIVNSAKTLVADSLLGLSYINPAVEINLDLTTVALRTPDSKKVHLACGGGSGHEPAHAAFVGEGMLSAAICGQVFASPNSGQVYSILDKFSTAEGVVIIVKNYTGDVLQFGLARERWAAAHPGSDTVRLVVVGDDCAVPRSQGKLTGRRGLAATVVVYKIAGALAAAGGTVDEVEHIARLVSERSGTMGIGLEHCHVPGTGKAQAYLGDEEVEIGMGIHNEPGLRKASPVPSAAKLVEEMLSTIIDTSDKERSFVPFKHDGQDEVILLINNLGGLPDLELGVVVKEAVEFLAKKKITVQRVLSGAFMTSLNLPGFSISTVLLPREAVQPEKFSSKRTFDSELLLELLDAPTDAPAWRWHYKGKPKSSVVDPKEKKSVQKETTSEVKGPAPTDPELFISAIENALKAVIKAEPEITHYDTIAGDGDAGLNLKAGAEGVQNKINDSAFSSTDTVAALAVISEVVDKEMGGTSGGIFSIFFAGLAKSLLQAQEEKKSDKATVEVWARALDLALNTLYQYTLARPPSRTLVDPLAAFIVTLSSDPSNMTAAFSAAKEAADATRSIDATAGRAAYVDKEKLSKADVPDAGAWGVHVILDAIRESIVAAK